MKSAHLKLLGCKCNSPSIYLTSTDSSVVARFPHLFGQFHFEGVHQSKPYVTNPSLNPAFQPSQAILTQLKPDSSNPRVKRAVAKIPCSDQLQNRLDDQMQQVTKILLASIPSQRERLQLGYTIDPLEGWWREDQKTNDGSRGTYHGV